MSSIRSVVFPNKNGFRYFSTAGFTRSARWVKVAHPYPYSPSWSVVILTTVSRVPAGSHSITLISLMRGVAMPRVARATCSCDCKRGEATPTRPALPRDFNNVRRFMDILSSPPLFACSQMSFHYVRVQLSAEPGFAGYADMSILDIGTVQQKQLVHP